MSTNSNGRPLEGRVALVTGGSRGLGRAMVERFVADGARVVFTYRSNEQAAQAVLDAVREQGGEAHGLQADLGTVEGVEGLFTELDRLFGAQPHLDVLVTNAGIIHHGAIQDVTEADFDRVFGLNVKSVFFTIQAALERMRDDGRIVLLGSDLTRMNMPEYVTYSAAKCALTSLATVLAKQLGARGITVNVLAPGAIDTDMNPWLRSAEGIEHMSSATALGRVGHADDIADVAAFLASKDSRWVTGQRIEASGGQQL